jgi:hypothetical protein
MKKTVFAMFSSIILASALIITSLAQGHTVQSPQVIQVAPDIEVEVAAFPQQSAGLFTRISNGSANPGLTSSWVRFTIRNKSNTPTGNFTYKMVARDGQTKLYDPPAAQMSLNGKEEKVFPMVKLNHDGKSFAISAVILADIGNFVKESSEANNKHEVKYTGSNVW